MRVQRITKIQIVLAGLILVGMFGVGIAFAWMQDTTYAKVLTGQVTDERSKQPLTSAIVRITRPGETARDYKVDENGRYRVGASIGTITISVQARGFQTTNGTFNASDPLVQEFPLDVVLRPWVLNGVVKDGATQKPIPAATLNAGEATTQSAADGTFALERLEPGSTVHVAATGYFPGDVQWTGDGALEFVLMPKTVGLAVSDSGTGKPIKATVQIGEDKYTTGDDGRATIREPAVNAKISASAEDFATTEATYTGQALVEIALKAGAFRAFVRDVKTNKPIAGATVYVDGGATLTTSDAGKISLPDATPGLSLTVKMPGYALARTVVTNTPSLDIALTPFTARGIYVPFGLLSLQTRIKSLLDLVDQTSLNSIVVDVKSDRGLLAWHSNNPLIKSVGADLVTMDLKTLISLAHDKKIYVIARVVTFKDEGLAKARPDLVMKSKSGAIWRDGENLAWANPYLREVWDYNIAIAKDVAALGFDEIQFDYIRFPSDGAVGNIYYPQTNTPDTRAAALKGFLNAVNAALKPYPIFVSADVFGMTIWTHDDMGIGQHLEDVAQRVDYISPMIYPSTFSSDNLGYANPPAHPYEVIYRSVKKAAERTTTLVRPWLQAYSIRNAPYGLTQYLTQKQAANDASSAGWLFWNAGGTYPTSLFYGN
jgi:hypothetical protein